MRPSGPAPDYTNPFLVSAFALTFCALATIWAAGGIVVALLVAWLADRTIVGLAETARAVRRPDALAIPMRTDEDRGPR